MQGKEPRDERLVYEPPRAMHLRDTHAGAGACNPPGSGDEEGCFGPGNFASGGGCGSPGNNASGPRGCRDPGNSPVAAD